MSFHVASIARSFGQILDEGDFRAKPRGTKSRTLSLTFDIQKITEEPTNRTNLLE